MDIKFIKYSFSIILVSLFALTSCTEENEESIVLTEDILYLSGERVRLSGRIYSNNGDAISDHGFEIALNESFTDPIIIQNGPKNSIGAFIGESLKLASENDYYYRAFAIIGNSITYGATKPFRTLQVSVKSYDPKVSYSQAIVTIIGSNFPSDIKVFFGEVEAEILNLDLEAIITVKVPEVGNNTLVDITIKNDDIEIVLEEPFEYIFGEWTKKSAFTSSSRFINTISISTADNFVIGLGKNLLDVDPNNPNSKMWEYDKILGTWSEIIFSGEPTFGGFYNDEGYFGSGITGVTDGFGLSQIPGFEFWKYENGSINYVGEIPFASNKAISFFYDGNVYVLGGLDLNGGYNSTSYRYSESTDSWTVLGSIPIEMTQELPHFAFGNFHYFITSDNEIWSYNISGDVWGKIGNTPITIGTGNGISEVINDKAYIGIFSFDNRIWEYDIIKNTWRVKSQIEDVKSNQNAGSYVLDSKVTVIRLSPNASDSDWIQSWEFDPTAF